MAYVLYELKKKYPVDGFADVDPGNTPEQSFSAIRQVHYDAYYDALNQMDFCSIGQELVALP